MLAVSHLQQRSQADCLPTCAQMALTYLGLKPSYPALLKLLETRSFGTPFRNLQRLQQLDVQVTCQACSGDEFPTFLNAGWPLIASVNTADFGYWSTAVDHAVLVVGADQQAIYVHDPSMRSGPTPIALTEFALAQLKFDHLCAIIQR